MRERTNRKPAHTLRGSFGAFSLKTTIEFREPLFKVAPFFMRAAVLYGKEQVRVEQIPARPLRPGEVRVQVEAALTCGTDLKVFRRGYHAP